MEEDMSVIEERIIRAYLKRIESEATAKEPEDYPSYTLICSYHSFLECAEKRRLVEKT